MSIQNSEANSSFLDLLNHSKVEADVEVAYAISILNNAGNEHIKLIYDSNVNIDLIIENYISKTSL